MTYQIILRAIEKVLCDAVGSSVAERAKSAKSSPGTRWNTCPIAFTMDVPLLNYYLIIIYDATCTNRTLCGTREKCSTVPFRPIALPDRLQVKHELNDRRITPSQIFG